MIIQGKYAASNFFVKQGIALDTAKNCFKKSYRIINLFNFSDKCAPIPRPDYVLLFRTLYAKCEPCEMEDFESSSLVQLSLVYRKNRRLIVHEGKNFAEAKSMAFQLAKEYGLKIRDSATNRRKPEWINVMPPGFDKI